MTPPLKPESSNWIGCASAEAGTALPPFDFIIAHGARSDIFSKRRRILSMYVPIVGLT